MFMDEPKNDDIGQLPTQGAVNIRRAKALELRRKGLTTQAIADQLGITRQTVSEYLNSRNIKEMIEAENRRFAQHVAGSVDVYGYILSLAKTDPTNALKAAKDVLKTVGIVKETVDIAHSFPKPTIIKRLDGTTVVLGTEKVVEEIKDESDK